MSYEVGFTPGAREDLLRLYDFLLQHDVAAARRARDAIAAAMDSLRDFPFACRKVKADDPFLREMLIPFGPRATLSFSRSKMTAS